MPSRRFLLTAVPCALFTHRAQAHDYRLGSLEIVHPWARATAPTAKAGGGYLKVTNKGTAADRLIEVRSAAALRIELHETRMEGSIMRMREIEKGIEIAPGATVELKPGGYHVMFLDLKAPFEKGAKVPATLVFEKAGTIAVEFRIEAMGASGSHH